MECGDSSPLSLPLPMARIEVAILVRWVGVLDDPPLGRLIKN